MRVTSMTASLVLTLSQSPAVAEDSKTASARAAMDYVRDHVAALDDGKMDPHRLAELIMPLCHGLHEASAQAIQPEQWNATSVDKRHELEFVHTLAAVYWSLESLAHGR